MTGLIRTELLVRQMFVLSMLSATGGAFVADMVIVIDNSFSITDRNMSIILNAVNSLPDYLNISSDVVRVGMVQYSHTALVELPLTSNLSVITNYIQNWKNKSKTDSRTTLGLRNAKQILDNSNRPNVPKYVLLLTDGNLSDRFSAETEAKRLHNAGIKIYILNVERNKNVTQHMINMAGDRSRVNTIKNYSVFEKTFRKLIGKIVEDDFCSKCAPGSCPANCIGNGPQNSAGSKATVANSAAVTDTKEPLTGQPPGATGHPLQPTDGLLQPSVTAKPAASASLPKLRPEDVLNQKMLLPRNDRLNIVGAIIMYIVMLGLVGLMALYVKYKKIGYSASSDLFDKPDSTGNKQLEKVDEKSSNDGKFRIELPTRKHVLEEKSATGNDFKNIDRSLEATLSNGSSLQKSASRDPTRNFPLHNGKLAPKDAKTATKDAKLGLHKVAGKSAEGK